MKQNLLNELCIHLLKKGFIVKNLNRPFDVLARKDSQILLIKVLIDANSVTEELALEMRNMASCIEGAALIIAEKAGTNLEENIVYTRFGLYTLNFNTFRNILNKKYPFIKRSKAGLTANIIGKKLKESRQQQGISLSSLSKKLGVSSRMVLKYESGVSQITLNKALKMYDLFGHEVFNKIDILCIKEEEQKYSSDFLKKYNELGFRATEMKKMASFDIIAKKQKDIILTEISDKVNPEMQSLSRLLDAEPLIIFKKKKPMDFPSLTKKEFMEFEQANELVKFLKEF